MVVLTLCKQTNKQTNEQKAKNDLSSLIALSLTPPSQKLLLVENASLLSIFLLRLLHDLQYNQKTTTRVWSAGPSLLVSPCALD